MINLTFETFDEMVAFAGQILGTQTAVGASVSTHTDIKPSMPVIPEAPATQQPVTPQAPTQMPTYSIDQIAVGAIQLKDAGRLGEFQQLLAKFGVAALTQLQPAQLPEIAAELQKMGVKL
jgi:hypothetical protein